MKSHIKFLSLAAFLGLLISLSLHRVNASEKKDSAKQPSSTQTTSSEVSLYDFKVQDSRGKPVALADYKGKVVLIVNVASKCGFTNQYEGLQKLFETYEKQGLVILGFPSNQFLSQEPGSNEEIQKFCKLNYGVKFPVLAKVDVNGQDAIPLFKWLTSDKKLGGRVTCNFNKFLIDRSGKFIQRFGSSDTPAEIEKDIVKVLESK